MGDDQRFDSFLFPLPLLAFGADWKVRVDAICAWCIYDKGSERLPKLKPAQVKNVFQAFPAGKMPTRGGCDLTNWEAFVIGSHAHTVVFGDAQRELNLLNEAKALLSTLQSRFGPPPMALIGRDMLLDSRDGKSDFNPRDISILIAINSALGVKPYARITRNRLRAAMLGYPRTNILFDEDGYLHEEGSILIASRTDSAVLLSLDQMRHSLDSLERKGCFIRYHVPKSSSTFFSTKWSRLAVAAAVAEKFEALAAREPETKDFDQRIAEARSKLSKARGLKPAIKRGMAGDLPGHRNGSPRPIPGDAPAMPQCVPGDTPAVSPPLSPPMAPLKATLNVAFECSSTCSLERGESVREGTDKEEAFPEEQLPEDKS